jgi:hypothetical protein
MGILSTWRLPDPSAAAQALRLEVQRLSSPRVLSGASAGKSACSIFLLLLPRTYVLFASKKALSGSSECLRASECLTIPSARGAIIFRNTCYSSECFTSEHFTMTWNKWSNSPFRHIAEFCNNSRRNALRFPRIICEPFIQLTRYGRNIYECLVKQLRLALKLLFKDFR